MKLSSNLIARIAWASVLVGSPYAWGQLRFSWNLQPLIRYVEGTVLLDGQNVVLEPDNSYLPDGHVLGTAQGRVQTSLASASPVVTNAFLAENSSLKMLSSQLPDQALEMLSGSAIIECRFPSKDAGAGLSSIYKEITIDLSKSGEYRIDAVQGRLRVYQGEATVSYGVGLECTRDLGCRRVVGHRQANTVQVHKGEQVNLDEGLQGSTFDTKDTDAFYHWVRRRLSATPRVLAAIEFPCFHFPSTEDNNHAFPGVPPIGYTSLLRIPSRLPRLVPLHRRTFEVLTVQPLVSRIARVAESDCRDGFMKCPIEGAPPQNPWNLAKDWCVWIWYDEVCFGFGCADCGDRLAGRGDPGF